MKYTYEMQDIRHIKDIEILVNQFYKKVLDNQTLGPIFKETIAFDWEQHIPKMYQFWESILFHKASYKGNPMLVHLKLNQKIPLTKSHFKIWLQLWAETVDSLFQGKVAQIAKEKAQSIGALMQMKIKQL